MRKNLYWLFLNIVFVLGMAMVRIGTASPETPVIHVEPQNSTAAVGETFVVSITVTEITEQQSLYGWECRITFNSGIINAVNASEGPFLKDTGYDTIWLSPNMDNTAGTIDVGALIMPSAEWGGFPPNGAVGSGTLATVTFKVVGQGSTDLEFKETEDTELHTVIIAGGTQTESPITHTAEKGFFSNAGASFPPYIIAGIVVVVVVCAVAAFYFWRKRA